MGFMDNMKETLNDGIENISVTENGAVGFSSTGKNLLDFFFAVSSMRNQSDMEINRKYEKAYADDALLALKLLAYVRDVRGGLGEKRTPRTIYRYLAQTQPKIAKAIIPLIPEYGRWDDLYAFFGTKLQEDAVGVIAEQFTKDLLNRKNNKPISLLAKWLPSENASSKESKKRAKIIREFLSLTSRNYRKTLSDLRGYLKVVEKKMSSGEWSEINYEAVPSKANVLYRNAFLKHDEERRRSYLESLAKGEVKINSSTNFPHDIVHAYSNGYRGWGFPSISAVDDALEALWKALPNMVGENDNTLVVRDGSGSMTVTIDPNAKTTALDVSTALAVYFAERAGGEYKNKFITFSNYPRFIDLSKCKTLADKLRKCYAEDDCSNTDIEATFDLVLDTAITHHLTQEELPKNILIVSDMEFDGATSYGWNPDKRRMDTLFERIEKKFKSHGYMMPRLVFWNVNSRTGTIPVKENALGVALVSGFSVNICNMVLSGELDPYKCLVDQLETERYKPVEVAVEGLI